MFVIVVHLYSLPVAFSLISSPEESLAAKGSGAVKVAPCSLIRVWDDSAKNNSLCLAYWLFDKYSPQWSHRNLQVDARRLFPQVRGILNGFGSKLFNLCQVSSSTPAVFCPFPVVVLGNSSCLASLSIKDKRFRSRDIQSSVLFRSHIS